MSAVLELFYCVYPRLAILKVLCTLLLNKKFRFQKKWENVESMNLISTSVLSVLTNTNIYLTAEGVGVFC